MDDNKLVGVATLLKTPEGEIKLPRTAAVLVQTADGSNVEAELMKKISIEDYSKEIGDMVDLMNEFDKSIREFRYDIGTSANYTELALLNRKASELIDDFKIAIEDMEVFLVWDEKWDNIKKEIDEAISTLATKMSDMENDITDLTLRVKCLEDIPTIEDENLTTMLATVDMFEMMIDNHMRIDPERIDNIVEIYKELLRREIKGINEMPSIIKEKIVNQLLI